MKKLTLLILLLACFLLSPGCKTGEGCPTDAWNQEIESLDQLDSKRGKSGLFSKKEQKKMKSRKKK